jgi:hypothetical protein
MQKKGQVGPFVRPGFDPVMLQETTAMETYQYSGCIDHINYQTGYSYGEIIADLLEYYWTRDIQRLPFSAISINGRTYNMRNQQPHTDFSELLEHIHRVLILAHATMLAEVFAKYVQWDAGKKKLVFEASEIAVVDNDPYLQRLRYAFGVSLHHALRVTSEKRSHGEAFSWYLNHGIVNGELRMAVAASSFPGYQNRGTKSDIELGFIVNIQAYTIRRFLSEIQKLAPASMMTRREKLVLEERLEKIFFGKNGIKKLVMALYPN